MDRKRTRKASTFKQLKLQFFIVSAIITEVQRVERTSAPRGDENMTPTAPVAPAVTELKASHPRMG